MILDRANLWYGFKYLCMQVNDFVCISDKAYVSEQVLAMEKSILGKLEWHLTVPTPYVFLVRYIKASTPSDKEVWFFFVALRIFFCPSWQVQCTHTQNLINKFSSNVDGEYGVFPRWT